MVAGAPDLITVLSWLAAHGHLHVDEFPHGLSDPLIAPRGPHGRLRYGLTYLCEESIRPHWLPGRQLQGELHEPPDVVVVLPWGGTVEATQDYEMIRVVPQVLD